ncbi:MAG: hypothetical protein P8074_27330 [Anaerolineales bacterium]|jgi:hypothetical protein
MDDVQRYRIKVRGKVQASDLNATSPLRLSVERVEQASTLLSVRTDQSGLIGMIRHLHGLGLILLSIDCFDADTGETLSADPL